MGVYKFALFILMTSNVCADSWYQQKSQGWHWYKDPVLPKVVPQSHKGSKPQAPKSYRQQLKEFQAKVEEVQAKAVLNPTVDNVRDYIRIHDLVLNKSSQFKDVWMYASLLTPDPKEQENSSPKAREIKQRSDSQRLEEKIRGLSKTHGLFFVFKSGCRFCHEFAPLVRSFAHQYGFEVKAISADGGQIPEFPEAAMDNGTIALINPKGIYPALFLVNPQEGTVNPIAWGMINESDLKENIHHFIQYSEANHAR